MRKLVEIVAGFMLGLGSLVILIACIRAVWAMVVGDGPEQVADLFSAATLAGAGVVTVLISGTAWILVDVANKLDRWVIPVSKEGERRRLLVHPGSLTGKSSSGIGRG